MGKKSKKKTRVLPPKEKRASPISQKNAQLEKGASAETVDDGVSIENEKKPCPHIHKGFDLSALSAKLGSTKSIRCEDCREGASDRRGNSGKGKHGKKNKGSSSADSKSNSKAIWICLECGHYGCGGVGLPTIPQSHVVRHTRLTRHPIVIQLERPNLRWCFPCNAQIPVEKIEDSTGEAKDVYAEVVKLIKGGSTKVFEGDVEDLWFGGGSVTSGVTVREESTFSGRFEDRDGYYAVRGLVNLGNTCFFNSVMQNLLSMERLRDSLLKLNATFGPLTVSLKKLFSEIKGEEGKKNAINPRSLFGSLCVKAPQFRGYQQHDSHELLRCLLDVLATEEIDMRKQMNEKVDGALPSNQCVTLVDSIFGGQISSSVCCVECGHSSTVYEPFLDLSLPVPTKKPPPKKTSVSRANKAKVVPRRGNRPRGKPPIARTVSDNAEPSPEVQSSTPFSESTSSSSSDSRLQNIVDSTDNSGERSPVLPDCGTKKDIKNGISTENAVEQTGASFAEFTWLDYLDPEPVGDEINFVAEDCNSLHVQDCGTKKDIKNGISTENAVEQTGASFAEFTWLDYLDPEPVGDEINFVAEDCNSPHVQDSLDDSTWMDYLCPETTSKNNYLPFQAGDVTAEDVMLQNCLLESCSKATAADSLDQNSSCIEEPLQVQDSQVLLLPYKEDAQVSGDGADESEFGFGDLFMEPDMDPVPARDTSVGPEMEVAESSFMAGNSSESDPGEVDNSESPVSVESCLAHFTKPELLSKDNAWHCEKCSKTLHLKNKRKQTESPKLEPNESDSTNVVKVENLSNGYTKSDNSVDIVNVIAQNEEIDGSFQDWTKYANSKVNGGETGVLIQETSETLSCNNSSCQASSIDHATEPCGTDVRGSSSCLPKVQLDDVDDETETMTVKVKRDATKRSLIFKGPPILTIHLKRFSQDTRGRLNKLSGHVAFRETIDLSPYMVSRGKDKKDKCTYRLTGVVEHLGTMRGGHYVAYVRGGGNGGSIWYHASDAYVREVSLDQVLRSEAYILFYEII